MARGTAEERIYRTTWRQKLSARVKSVVARFRLATLGHTLRLTIAFATTFLAVVAMFFFTSTAYEHMSLLALKIAAFAKWAITGLVALGAIIVLIESRKSDSARTARLVSLINIFLTIFLKLGLEPPPKFSVKELSALKEFNAEYDGVQITPDLEEIAKGVELSNETDPLRLAQSKLARGKLEDAINLFDKSLVEMKDMERVIAETHFYRAVCLSRLGRDEEAIAEADLAHAILPRMSAATFFKCRSLRRLHRLEEALPVCNQALSEDPMNGLAWGEKGVILIEMGTRAMDRKPNLLEEGIAASDISIKLLPKNPSPWNNKSVALRHLNRQAEAIEAADKALALKPDLSDALLNKASALKHMGRLDEAAAIYQGMTRKNPYDPEAWNNLGDTFEEKGEVEKALEYYSAATQSRTNYGDAWYNKGHMLNLLGRYSEASVALGRAVELNDKDDEALYQQAVAFLHLGKRTEAINALEKGIALNKDSKELKKLLAHAKKGK